MADNDWRSPFDPSLDDMRSMAADVVALASRFVDTRYEAPSSDYLAVDAMLETLSGPPPAQPTPLPQLLDVVEEAASKGFDTANPGFVGYIPGGGLFAAALGDFLACVVNRYTGLSRPAPALVQLEASVLRWLCDTFGLPPQAQGVLTPGGSMSNLSAIVTARTAMLGEGFLDGTLYVSDQVHHSIAKSAQIAGLPAGAVRVVPADASLRMDVDALSTMVSADRAAGRRPFLVVASAGTVNTGAVDPIGAVADVAAAQELWCHVDAAYGGFFQLTDRGQTILRGIERADSVTLDPHKGLFLPYGTGCLLVRDGSALRRAHDVHAGYLPPLSDAPGLPDFSSYGPELTRDFRGLRLWLPLHLYGVDTFVAALDEKLDLASWVHDELRAVPSLDVPWPPELSLVAFRPRDATEAETVAMLDRINGSDRVWLSSAPVHGDTYLRVCILSHRSRPARMRELVEIIRGAVAV